MEEQSPKVPLSLRAMKNSAVSGKERVGHHVAAHIPHPSVRIHPALLPRPRLLQAFGQ